jgi:hypothetical protein
MSWTHPTLIILADTAKVGASCASSGMSARGSAGGMPGAMRSMPATTPKAGLPSRSTFAGQRVESIVGAGACPDRSPREDRGARLRRQVRALFECEAQADLFV